MSVQHRNGNIRQSGAVSLFIVVFTALLMIIITVSFVQLMTADQRQATNSDLSQSAYDSAQAGVEDAKRALLIQQDCIGKDTQLCRDVRGAIAAEECNTLSAIFGNPTDAETTIQQNTGDRKLDQGYTCVKIRPDTPDFLGSLDPDISPVLVPLRAAETISKIIVSWGINKDGGTVNLPSSASADLPPVGAAWPENRPALLRVQLINGKGNFQLSDFDRSGYSDTLFLYPSAVGTTTASFVLDTRRSPPLSNKPQLVRCSPGAGIGAYICQATLDFTSPIGAGSQTAFLSLSGLYNATDFKVELMDGNGRTVSFDGVQPEIDSTGRANDLFRRVVSRVEKGANFNYPQAELEVTGKLCKNFSVTTEGSDYSNECSP